jgi:hypothetical protein
MAHICRMKRRHFYTIRELRKKSVYEDDLSLRMIVKDQAGHEPG